MEDLPADLREFLQNEPFLELTADKKIKCTLNGHEFPCKLAELQNFITGKKYKKLLTGAEFNYSQYEPHVVQSTKQPNQLFCKLTLRHLNHVPHHVLRHVNGKRFKKALAQYEECMKQGVAFVPARLRQKRQPKHTDEAMESSSKGGNKQKQDSGIWASNDSDVEGSDSEDSMSDLYPPTLFSLKSDRQDEVENGEDEDDFQTDDDDMEVSDTEEEKQAAQKRKKVQFGAGCNKKFKKNRKRKGFKPISKVKNGK
ncbi:surfeit locus protein 2 [Trichomycterus rosablanca]|uniref:surfeit locus protein 2 n=1 Tax=Trichomycterus rosablanca TaxID=2290929 RepID=UPI002F35FAE5